MDPISGIGPAAAIDPLVHPVPRQHDAIHGTGTSKTVSTHADGSIVVTVTDAEGRVVSRGAESAQVSTVTTPDGAVLDRIMSPHGGVMFVNATFPAVPEPASVPDADANGAPPKHLDLLV